MPYFEIYTPPASKRIIELLRLHRWCWKCNDWASLIHFHRGPIRTIPSAALPELADVRENANSPLR